MKVRQTIGHRIDREKTKPIEPLAFVDDTFMNNQQIAEMFAISDDTVLNAQNDGELPYCLFGRAHSTRKTRRSPRRAVLAWAAARLVRSAA